MTTSKTVSLALLALFLGCGAPEPDDGVTSREADLILLAEYREDIALLAAKYGQDTADVREAVHGYLRAVDFVFRDFAVDTLRDSPLDDIYPPVDRTAIAIDSMAAHTQIPKEVLAALLFDLRLAEAARQVN